VIIGVYSSVFIASPIMYDLDKGNRLKAAKTGTPAKK
jgi:preprotein translocase subunit SecF